MEKKTIQWDKSLALFEKLIRVVWLKDGTPLTKFQVGSFGPKEDPDKIPIRAYDENVITWRYYTDKGQYVPQQIMTFVLSETTFKHYGNPRKDIHEIEIFDSEVKEKDREDQLQN